MATIVELKEEIPNARIQVGQQGYIDGFVQSQTDRHHAVVVSGANIDILPLHALEVVGNSTAIYQGVLLQLLTDILGVITDIYDVLPWSKNAEGVLVAKEVIPAPE